ncbi:MAG TPA: hypothetical protein PK640_02245 [Verrucomicrobiota bacterium]|nr:hypothetical protein [Verrucomicrobiota bacterium]
MPERIRNRHDHQKAIAQAVSMTHQGIAVVLQEILELEKVANPSEIDEKSGLTPEAVSQITHCE